MEAFNHLLAVANAGVLERGLAEVLFYGPRATVAVATAWLLYKGAALCVKVAFSWMFGGAAPLPPVVNQAPIVVPAPLAPVAPPKPLAPPKPAVANVQKAQPAAAGGAKLLPVTENLGHTVQRWTRAVASTLTSVTLTEAELAKKQLLASGGEGDFYLASPQQGWKIIRNPDHSLLANNPSAREGARLRLAALPNKLAVFPHPGFAGDRVVLPTGTIRIAGRPEAVGGLVLPFIDGISLTAYTTKKGQRDHNLNLEDVGKVFLDLYDTLVLEHRQGFKLGDFKPDNVRVKDGKAYVLDMDSASVGPFGCTVFTEGFVDPKLCDKSKDEEVLCEEYTESSDWYSFTVMLHQAVTGCGPYDGEHKPPAGQPIVPDSARALRGVSIYNPHVIPPSCAHHSLQQLSPKLRDLFERVFEKGERGRPPRDLLEELAGAGSGRKLKEPLSPLKNTCWSSLKLPSKTPVSGTPLTVKDISRPGAKALCGKMYRGTGGSQPELTALFHEASQLTDQEGRRVYPDDRGTVTWADFGDQVIVAGEGFRAKEDTPSCGPFALDRLWMDRGDPNRCLKINSVDRAPTHSPNICTIGKHVVWLAGGELLSTHCSSAVAKISGPVSLFGGETFGLVVATSENSGELLQLFLLKKGQHDAIHILGLTSLPPILGEIRGIEVRFSENLAWVLMTAKWEGAKTNYILVLDHNGVIRGLGAAKDIAGAWHSPESLHSAFERREQNGQLTFGLTALEGDIAFQLHCINGEIRLDSAHRVQVPSQPSLMISDGNSLFFA